MAGNLVIGATVDVEALKAGFDSSTEVVKSGTQMMSVSFQELSTTASRASRQITDDTKAAAISISTDWQSAAEASYAYAQAQQEVRAASVLVRESAGEDANAISVLAAAQRRAAIAATERAAAQRVAATADQAAALASLSAGEQLQLAVLSQAAVMRTIPVAAESAGAGIAAAFRAAYASVVSSLTGIGEALGVVQGRFVETAETAELSATGMTAAFSGLSTLLGAGIAVGFAAHFIDEIVDVQVELKHLHEGTGVAIQTLAGLRAVVEQAGAQFEPFANGLTKLERAQTLALEGHKQQIAAFQRIGIELNQLKGATPEDLFFRVAEAMANVKSHADDATSAISLFGKGGAALIPVIREIGDSLREQATEQGKLSGITDESAERAAKWKQQTAQLSQTFRAFASEIVLPLVIPTIQALRSAFEVLGTTIITVFEAAGTFIVGTTKGLYGLGTVIKDVVTGNFSAIATDAIEAKNSTVAAFKDGGKEIAANWKALGGELKGIWSKTDITPTTDKKDTSQGTPPEKDTRMEDWKRQLQAMQDAEDGFHKLSLADEAAFWEQKLALARGTPNLYAEVYHQMREAQRKEQQESLKDDADQTRLAVSSEKSGSEQRLIIIREFLQHMHEMHAEQTEEFKQFTRMEVEEVRANEEHKKKLAMDTELEKIGATKSGTAEQIRVINEAMAVAAQLYGKDSEEYARMQKEKNRAQLEFAQKTKEAQQIELEADRNHQIALLNQEKERINEEHSLGLITSQQRIAMLKALEEEEFRIQQEALQRKLAGDQTDPDVNPAIRAKDQAQIEALEDAHNQRMLALDQQSTQQRAKLFLQLSQTIKSGMDNAVAGMISGTQSLAKSMQTLYTQIVTQIAQSLLHMVENWVLQHTIMGAIAKVFNLQQQTDAEASDTQITAAHLAAVSIRTQTDVAAAGIRNAALLGANTIAITSEAGLAGAAAFASVMAALPFPANVAAAPGVMAAAIATTLGNLSLGVAEKGAVLGKDMLVSAHKDEMILPARLSTGLQGMINSNSSSRNLSSSVSSQSSSHTNNIRIAPEIHYHGADAPRQTEADVAAMLRSAMRKGLVPSY